MGGRSKAQTVGYRYSLGVHLALCHGPVDAIREILVDRRTAWSVTTGGGFTGGGAAVETRIGTVAGMAATAALAGDLGARVTFPGSRAGLRVGRDYRLRLANGSSQTVALQGVSFDPLSNMTSWTVLPEALSFPAQSVEVFEATAGASNAGASGGRIRIDKPDLFGGESREGGIVGDVDVLMGGPGQGPNDYLSAQVGGSVPAYRGLCSLVLRQVYLGINPYLKPWAVRVTRVLTGEAGAPQWYPARAAIVPEASISDAAIYIALDVSGSMSGTRMAAQKAAVAALIREIGAGVDPDRPNDIRIVLWNAGVAGSIERRAMGPEDYAALFGFYPRSGFMHVDLGPARVWGERFPARAVPFAVEATPVREVLGESRTLRGAGAAGVATVGAAGVEVAQQVLARYAAPGVHRAGARRRSGDGLGAGG